LTAEACQFRLTSVDRTTDLAEAATHDDPEVGLAAVVALRGLLGQLEALQVKAAREQGWTWERIAQALGITRQSVHKKYAGGRRRGRRS
jgi:DNA-directed RNA polymerase specialized sigma24 family protein